jgi:hypothetical protein
MVLAIRTGHPAAAGAGQVHQQQRDRGRGHAGDALRLADRFRAHALELLPHFRGQAVHAGVVERGRDRGGLVMLPARDLVALAVEVAGILGADLDLLGDGGIGDGGRERRQRQQPGVIDSRALEQVERAGLPRQLDPERRGDFVAQRVVGRGPDRGQARALAFDRLALGLEAGEARVVDQAELAADAGQAQVGVVLAQLQPVLGARGEHAVGLAGALGDQIVDQHPGVGLIAAGVMPGMRCAWPTVSGHTRSSFCRTSADRPCTPA